MGYFHSNVIRNLSDLLYPIIFLTKMIVSYWVKVIMIWDYQKILVHYVSPNMSYHLN